MLIAFVKLLVTQVPLDFLEEETILIQSFVYGIGLERKFRCILPYVEILSVMLKYASRIRHYWTFFSGRSQ